MKMQPLQYSMSPGILAVMAVVLDDFRRILVGCLIKKFTFNGLHEIRKDFIHDQQERQIMTITSGLDGFLDCRIFPISRRPNRRIAAATSRTFHPRGETRSTSSHDIIVLRLVSHIQHMIKKITNNGNDELCVVAVQFDVLAVVML